MTVKSLQEQIDSLNRRIDELYQYIYKKEWLFENPPQYGKDQKIDKFIIKKQQMVYRQLGPGVGYYTYTYTIVDLDNGDIHDHVDEKDVKEFCSKK